MSVNRIKEARKAKGWTQRDLAKRMGVSQQTIQRYEAGLRDLRGNVLRDLCTALDVTATYLLDMNNPEEAPGGYFFVPLFGCIAAGAPLEMMSAERTHAIPSDVHTRWPEAFLLRVEGESMNRILPNGSYALVNPCTSIDYDGQPYALRVGESAGTIKRVTHTDCGYRLDPDSIDPAFRPLTIDASSPACDTFSIIGRVVWHCIPADWSY